jgi:serine/threonine protein kinase
MPSPTSPTSAQDTRIPSQIAQFEIVRRLGAGGMAEVFLAKKRGAEGTFKVVVVKRILPGFTTSRRFRSMFIDEAQICSSLSHPNLIEVFDFGDEGGELFMAMELIEGTTCARMVRAAAPCSCWWAMARTSASYGSRFSCT